MDHINGAEAAAYQDTQLHVSVRMKKNDQREEDSARHELLQK